MGNVLGKASKVLDFLEKYFIVFFLVGIVLMIFSGVLSRFVFHYAIAFTEELSRFFFIWGALLGAAAGMRTGEHSGIPLIANRFGPTGQKVIEFSVAIGVIVFLAYLVSMTWVSTARSFQSGQISTTTEIPIWTINAGMMIAFAVAVIRAVQGWFAGKFRPDIDIEIEEEA
ncbi:MAG: TRAP transporter small permease [Rhizobiaceae bacterium]